MSEISSSAAHGISAQWADLAAGIQPLHDALREARDALHTLTGLSEWSGSAAAETKAAVQPLIQAITAALQGIDSLVDRAIEQKEYWSDIADKIHNADVLDQVLLYAGIVLGSILGAVGGQLGALLFRGLAWLIKQLPGTLGRMTSAIASAGGRVSAAAQTGSNQGATSLARTGSSSLARSSTSAGGTTASRTSSTAGEAAGTAGAETALPTLGGSVKAVAAETLLGGLAESLITFAADAGARALTEKYTGIEADYSVSGLIAAGSFVGSLAGGAVKGTSSRLRTALADNPELEELLSPLLTGAVATVASIGFIEGHDKEVDSEEAFVLVAALGVLGGVGNIGSGRGFRWADNQLNLRRPGWASLGDDSTAPLPAVVPGSRGLDQNGQLVGPRPNPSLPDLIKRVKDSEADWKKARQERMAADRQTAEVPAAQARLGKREGGGRTPDETRDRAEQERRTAADQTALAQTHHRAATDPDATPQARDRAAAEEHQARTLTQQAQARGDRLTVLAERQAAIATTAEARQRDAKAAEDEKWTRARATAPDRRLINQQIDYQRYRTWLTEMWFRLPIGVANLLAARGLAGMLTDNFTPEDPDFTTGPPLGPFPVPHPVLPLPPTPPPPPPTPSPPPAPTPSPLVEADEASAALAGLQAGLRNVADEVNGLQDTINSELAALRSGDFPLDAGEDLKRRLTEAQADVVDLQRRISGTQGAVNGGGPLSREVLDGFVIETVALQASLSALTLEVTLTRSLTVAIGTV